MTICGAIDLGGTNLRGALVQSGGELEALAQRPARLATRETLLGDLHAEIDRLLGAGAQAIGISCAASVERGSGRLVWAGLLPLQDIALATDLRSRYRVPVAVHNDANCAAVAEHRAGAARCTDDALVIAVGTGIGGGAIVNGSLLLGADGIAAELGHLMVDPRGAPCQGGCAVPGHLEAVASGLALDRAVAETATALPDSPIGQAARAGEPATGRLAARLAVTGDAISIGVLRELGERLGAGLVTLVNLFNPEVIVFTGGVIAAGAFVLEPAEHVVRSLAMRPANETVRFAVASFGSNASLIGAGMLAHDLLRS